LPLEPNAVCTARVLIDGADELSELQNLKACPNTAGFNLAKLAVLEGPPGGPACDRRRHRAAALHGRLRRHYAPAADRRVRPQRRVAVQRPALT
jgi:hypothetical protein